MLPDLTGVSVLGFIREAVALGFIVGLCLRWLSGASPVGRSRSSDE